MTTALSVLLAIALLFCLYRVYWTYRSQPRVFTTEFDGKLFRVGETTIAMREGDPDADRSIVCFPGFLEDIRYFLELYAEEDCQLILVNNAAYHMPIQSDDIEALDWGKNPFKCGTIEYDGYHLGHVLKHLATGSQVILHGHSRGGAVVLETGRQFPELTNTKERYVRAVLEAAVLPGGKNAGRGSEPVVFFLTWLLMPIVLGHSRKAGTEQLLKQPMMQPTNPLKTELCSSISFTPVRYKTCLTSIRSTRAWERDVDLSIYENYDRIDVVIGQRDDVLDNRTMIASAEQGAQRNEGLNILHTQDTNHFIALEQPHYLISLL